MTAVHSAPDDTLSVLDGDSALSFVDFNDHEDHSQCNDEKQEQLERGNGADLQIINNGGDSLREAGYDTAEDDQRDAIADSVFRNFSPIHIRRQVPAMRTTTTNVKYSQLLSTSALLIRRAYVMPNA